MLASVKPHFRDDDPISESHAIMWFPDPSLRGFEPMARVSPLHVVSSQIAYLPSLPCRFEPDRSQFGTKRFADAVNPSAHQPVVTPCYQRE